MTTEPVHSRHFYDGYPLCWPMDREGEHTSTNVDADVTCTDCLAYMRGETPEETPVPIQPSQVVSRSNSDLCRIETITDNVHTPSAERMAQIVEVAGQFVRAVKGSTADPLRGRIDADLVDALPDRVVTPYDEACALLADPERYNALRALTFEERHECPIEDCRLSAEEHHRLAFGMIAELKALRRRVEELEHGAST